MFVTIFFLPFYVFEGGRREKKAIIKEKSGLLFRSNMPGKGGSPHVALLKPFDLHTSTMGQEQGCVTPRCANTLPVF